LKTVLITGANKGIGFETAKQLIQKGFRVVLAARNEVAGKDSTRALEQFGKNIFFLLMDVADEKSIQTAAKHFSELNLRIDVLINNAAVLMNYDKILEVDSKTMIETFKTNTLGPILVVQHFLKYLNKNSRIINVSSGWGSISSMENSPAAYSISKAGLNASTRLFASALSEKKISVNSVGPGWVRTSMGGHNAERSVEKGAETIVWIAAEASQNITNKFLKDKKEIDW
jgi:NAD(P)-dependent dehydrogenase (short-subunit alcohol dehydrogenase family)